MKKLMFAAIAAVSLVLPQLNAQESDAETENNPETEESKPAGKKKGKAPNPDTAAGKTEEQTKESVFSKQQSRIQQLMDKQKKAKRNSEKRRIAEMLKSEQSKLRSLHARCAKPIKDEIPLLKEQLRLCRPEKKSDLEAKLAAQEEKLKELDTAADLEKWCAAIKEAEGDAKKAPDPGSQTKKRKRKKKSK